MAHPIRGACSGLATLTICALCLVIVLRRQILLYLLPSPKQQIELRNQRGSALATMFDGSPGYGLEAPIVKALLAERMPRSGKLCTRPESLHSSLFDRIFTPSTVFAQDCEDACTTHFQADEWIDADCGEYTLCRYGSLYERGCAGHEFGCPSGGSLCGQISCPN